MSSEELIFPKSNVQIFKRKTFSVGQKIILYSATLLPILGTPAVILILSEKNISQTLVILLAIVPMLLALIVMGYLICNPKGPEKEFKLEEFDAVDSETHFSVVAGEIICLDGKKLEVKVVTPTVFGPAINILDDSGTSNSQNVAFEETSEWALRIAEAKYPGAKWKSDPRIEEAPRDVAEQARAAL